MRQFITIFGFGCTGATADKFTDTAAEGSPTETLEIASEIKQAFRVPERAWDLAVDSNGLIYATTQAGSLVYQWDPVTDNRDEIQNRFPDIVALNFSEDSTLFTTTDHGVTGTLSQRKDNEITVLANQSEDGTLFRWPADITLAPDESWVIADIEAHVAFQISTAEERNVSVLPVGSNSPEAVAFFEGNLIVGGSDGVYQKPWPVGPATKIDSRAAYGLAIYDGHLLASNPDQGLFVVEGPELRFEAGDLGARPGSLLVVDETLYVSDRVGEWVHQLVFSLAE